MKTTVSIRSVAVKTEVEKRSSLLGTRLVPLVLQRKGSPSEIFYAPQCHSCGQPILDLRMANVSTVNETDDELIPIGKLGDAEALLIPSAGAFAVHKECDETGRGYWVGAHCVFRNDQRREFERGRGM